MSAQITEQKSRNLLNSWLPSVLLIAVMLLLIAATRVYVGGPDGIEVVWKGELSFENTVVNLLDYSGLPRSAFARYPALMAQMEEMGFFDYEDSYRGLRKKHRIKKTTTEQTLEKQEEKKEEKQEDSSETQGLDARSPEAKSSDPEAKNPNQPEPGISEPGS